MLWQYRSEAGIPSEVPSETTGTIVRIIKEKKGKAFPFVYATLTSPGGHSIGLPVFRALSTRVGSAYCPGLTVSCLRLD